MDRNAFTSNKPDDSIITKSWNHSHLKTVQLGTVFIACIHLIYHLAFICGKFKR